MADEELDEFLQETSAENVTLEALGANRDTHRSIALEKEVCSLTGGHFWFGSNPDY